MLSSFFILIFIFLKLDTDNLKNEMVSTIVSIYSRTIHAAPWVITTKLFSVCSDCYFELTFVPSTRAVIFSNFTAVTKKLATCGSATSYILCILTEKFVHALSSQSNVLYLDKCWHIWDWLKFNVGINGSESSRWFRHQTFCMFHSEYRIARMNEHERRYRLNCAPFKILQKLTVAVTRDKRCWMNLLLGGG